MKLKKQKNSVSPEELTLPEDVAESYRFSYALTYEEAYEAFFMLTQKRSRHFTIFCGIGLTVIGILLLVLFALDSRKVHYFFLTILCVLLLFYMIYAPTMKARRGARGVQKAKGTYKIEIRDVGTVSLPNAKPIDLAGDKDARVIESDTIFVLRPNTGNTFCLPKRVMKEGEIYGVREIFKLYVPVVDRRRESEK